VSCGKGMRRGADCSKGNEVLQAAKEVAEG
jgi:hypothetical protein